MAAITLTPASGSIIATTTAVRVNVSEADQNNDAEFDDELYPASPENRFYLLFDNPDGDDGKSYEFGVNEDGDHEFNSYIFPNAGSWVVRLRDASDDSDVTTEAVTVS